MAGGYFVDFVLAIAVESCPLDLRGCSIICRGPVEDYVLASSTGIVDG